MLVYFLAKHSIFIKFFKILKIHEIFCENPRIIFVLFYEVHKENMFTINLEDGRDAPSKASIVHFLMYTNLICWIYINYTWIIGISMILIQKLCCVQNANRSSPNCRFIPEWKIFEWHICIKKKKKLWSFSRRKLYLWSIFNIT